MFTGRKCLFLFLTLFISIVCLSAVFSADNISSDELNYIDSNSEDNLFFEENTQIIDDNVLDSSSDNSRENTIAKIVKEDNVKSSSDNVFVFDEDGWSNYFKDDGELDESVVSEGSVLKFDGSFTDKEMLITVPVNITSAGDDTLFVDCVFYLLADNINVTGISMTGEGLEYLIYADGASYNTICNNDLTLTNFDDTVTHTIEMWDGDSNLIRNNHIKTVTPDKTMNWDTNTCDSTSIYVIGSDNLIIESNIVNTTVNREYYGSWGVGTIYGMYIKGNSINDKLQGLRILNNSVYTTGLRYTYGIGSVLSENNLLENNTVITSSVEYANGINLEVAVNSTVNNNTVDLSSSNFTYGIYCCGREGSSTIYVEGVVISNNTILTSSLISYSIELYVTRNNTINGNNISASVGFANGIATSQSNNNIIEYNIISLYNHMNGNIPNPDAINNNPAGIKVTALNSQSGWGDNNTIRYNNVVIEGPENEILPAIEVTTNNNTINGNYLISSLGVSDAGVNSTGSNNIYDNRPKNQKNVTFQLDDMIVKITDKIAVSLEIKDEYDNILTDGSVIVVVDDVIMANSTANNGLFEFELSNIACGVHTMEVTYVPVNDSYALTTNTATVEVIKTETQININKISSVKKGENMILTGKLIDESDNVLSNAVIKLTVNNGRATVKTDANGIFTYTYKTSKIGTNNISASYLGNEIYYPTNTTTTFKVNPLATTLEFDDMGTVSKGCLTVISGKLMDENNNPISNVQVKLIINGNTKTLKTDSNGKFTHNYTMSRMGSNNITVLFAGNGNYEASNATAVVEVVKGQSVVTIDSIGSVGRGSNVTISGTVADVWGNVIANAQVKVIINGSPKTIKADANGMFAYSYAMKKLGTNNVTVTFAGNSNYEASNSTTTFEVIKAE